MEMNTERRVLADAAFANKLNVIYHAYVDISGDLIAGALLGQVLYWFGTGKDGTSRAKIQAHGYTWIAKSRADWYDEIRISPKQYDRAAKILRDAGYIEVRTMKFRGNPTTHIRIIPEAIAAALDAWKASQVITISTEGEEPAAAGISPSSNNDLPKGEEQASRSGDIRLPDSGISSYTETTIKDCVKEHPTQAPDLAGAVAAHTSTVEYIAATFENVWKEYPRREGKQAARIAYEKALRGIGQRKPDGEAYTAEDILLQVKLYAAYMFHRIAEGEAEDRHIARGDNWFSRESWADDIPTISSRLGDYAEGVEYNRNVAAARMTAGAIARARASGDQGALQTLQDRFRNLLLAL